MIDVKSLNKLVEIIENFIGIIYFPEFGCMLQNYKEELLEDLTIYDGRGFYRSFTDVFKDATGLEMCYCISKKCSTLYFKWESGKAIIEDDTFKEVIGYVKNTLRFVFTYCSKQKREKLINEVVLKRDNRLFYSYLVVLAIMDSKEEFPELYLNLML